MDQRRSNKPLVVTTWGTRGSLPVSGEDAEIYGGNTTCIQIESSALPENGVLCIDTGTGFRPLVKKQRKEMGSLDILYTHFHRDHTDAAAICRPVYMQGLNVHVWGPMTSDGGPKRAFERLFYRPDHPVAFGELKDCLTFTDLTDPRTKVICFHKTGSVLLEKRTFNDFIARDTEHPKVTLAGGRTVLLSECLVVTMHEAVHPDPCIAYRFTDHPTGAVFVFVTDYEAQAQPPVSFRQFVHGADLLLHDAQYSETHYEQVTAGFGHSTPPYAVKVAKAAGNVRRLGLTHHEPMDGPKEIEQRLEEAKTAATALGLEADIFACRDEQRIEVLAA